MENLHLKKFYNESGRIIVESKSVFDYPLHTHAYYEMILYEPFGGRVLVNGKAIKIVSLSAILVSPLHFHEIEIGGDSRAQYIKVGFNADLLGELAPESSFVLQNIEENRFLHRLFVEILQNFENKAYLKHLINCAVFILRNEGSEITFSEASGGHRVSVNALKYINERFKEAITLPSVAEKMSVTPQYLSLAFTSSFGINFSQYLSNIRLSFAASMIENTNESITDICFEAGYSNFSHFSRSFKKKYGLSPREYKNRFAKK